MSQFLIGLELADLGSINMEVENLAIGMDVLMIRLEETFLVG